MESLLQQLLLVLLLLVSVSSNEIISYSPSSPTPPPRPSCLPPPPSSPQPPPPSPFPSPSPPLDSCFPPPPPPACSSPSPPAEPFSCSYPPPPSPVCPPPPPPYTCLRTPATAPTPALTGPAPSCGTHNWYYCIEVVRVCYLVADFYTRAAFHMDIRQFMASNKSFVSEESSELSMLALQMVEMIRWAEQAVGPVDYSMYKADSATFTRIANAAFGYKVTPPFDPFVSRVNGLVAGQMLVPLAASLSLGVIPELQCSEAISVVARLMNALCAQEATLRVLLFQDWQSFVDSSDYKVSDICNEVANFSSRLDLLDGVMPARRDWSRLPTAIPRSFQQARLRLQVLGFEAH